MTSLRIWFIGIFTTALLLNLLNMFIPEGVYGRLIRLLSGLTFLLVMVKPLLHADIRDVLSDIDWKYSQQEIQESTYCQDLLSEESSIIEEQTAAYIVKTANDIGITCTAQISCVVRDGVPYPSEVSMDIAYSSEISEMITRDLAITPEHQHWSGEQG